MYKVAVLSSTGGTNFQSLIDAQKSQVLSGNIEICCLITNRPGCGAVEKAKAAGIEIYAVEAQGKTREEFDEEVMEILDQHQVDLVVLGGYMRIISTSMIEQYKNKIINIHPSLLPKFSGGMNMDVHRAVIEAGEKETGITIHLVDEGVDTGAVILQKSVSVEGDDTPEGLKAKVQELEKEWYPKIVQMFADGKVHIEDNQVTINE